MTTAYSYQRFSTKIQAKGDSLRRQLDAVHNYCNNRNLSLSESTYSDLGISAFNGSNVNEDAALGTFLIACDNGCIPRGSFLLVESLDRLSRAKVLTALSQFLQIINYGITIVTLIDEREYSDSSNTTDLIISLTIMERSYEESATKSKRIKAAWANKRNNPTTAKKIKNCPFWLRLNSKSNVYEVIEEKASLVREIYQMSIDGFGTLKIMNTLNEKEIKAPKGGAWANTSVNRILAERRALGEYQPHVRHEGKRVPIGEVITGFYPRIIDDNTFHLSASRRSGRTIKRKGRRGNTFSNLFIDVAHCSSCGSRMIYKDKGNGLKYLTCANRVKKVCDNKPVRYELFNQFIYEVYLTPQFYKSVTRLSLPKKISEGESLEVLTSHLDSANNSLDALLASIGQKTNPIIQKHIDARYKSIADIQTKINNFQQRTVESLSVHQSFNEAVKLVNSCFDITRSNDDLFKDRSRLNRNLVNGLDGMKVLNNKGNIFIDVGNWKYNYLGDRWNIIGSSSSLEC